MSICLGTPPKEFTWSYYDKSKQYHKVGSISPLDFYRDHVKPHFDAGSKVCLVTDPRPENPTGKTYSVDCLGNVVGGRKTIYNNQPVETLVDIAAKSIKAGEPVWFGCEVTQQYLTVFINNDVFYFTSNKISSPQENDFYTFACRSANIWPLSKES